MVKYNTIIRGLHTVVRSQTSPNTAIFVRWLCYSAVSHVCMKCIVYWMSMIEVHLLNGKADIKDRCSLTHILCIVEWFL